MGVGAESAVNRSTGLNLNTDPDQAAQNFSRTAEQHHGADIEVGRADTDRNFDHVQNGDIGDDRQTDNDLHAEAKLHMQGDTGFGIGRNTQVDLADGIDTGDLQGEAHYVQTTLKVDKCAGRRDELLKIGRNGQYFVEVEADFQTRFELQRRCRVKGQFLRTGKLDDRNCL